VKRSEFPLDVTPGKGVLQIIGSRSRHNSAKYEENYHSGCFYHYSLPMPGIMHIAHDAGTGLFLTME
jgi:hypothetical protein